MLTIVQLIRMLLGSLEEPGADIGKASFKLSGQLLPAPLQFPPLLRILRYHKSKSRVFSSSLTFLPAFGLR